MSDKNHQKVSCQKRTCVSTLEEFDIWITGSKVWSLILTGVGVGGSKDFFENESSLPFGELEIDCQIHLTTKCCKIEQNRWNLHANAALQPKNPPPDEKHWWQEKRTDNFCNKYHEPKIKKIKSVRIKKFCEIQKITHHKSETQKHTSQKEIAENEN